jgi:hypothetical protein
MKHGKRLLLRHKRLLSSQGHNPSDFLYTKDTAQHVEFLQKSTGKLLVIRR